MPKTQESKHDRFLRLMQRRLERSLEELRLVSQLSSTNYENTPEEAVEVIKHLDEAVRHIAQTFDVDYATRIGKGASKTTGNAEPIKPQIVKKTVMDNIQLAHALDHLRAGNLNELEQTLRSALI